MNLHENAFIIQEKPHKTFFAVRNVLVITCIILGSEFKCIVCSLSSHFEYIVMKALKSNHHCR